MGLFDNDKNRKTPSLFGTPPNPVAEELGWQALGTPTRMIPDPLGREQRQIGADSLGISNPDDQMGAAIFGVKDRR